MSTNQNINHIASKDAYEKIKQGKAILLDIREWEEIEIFAYDVEPQIILPMSEFNYRHHEIPTDREVIIACNSGSRSSQLTLYLKEKQYNNVVNLFGGIQEWLVQQLPVKWDNEIPEEKKKRA